MPELRFNLGHGYLRYHVPTKMDMIAFLVKLRHCKSGFYYNQNDEDGIVWAKTLAYYNDILKLTP